jgi:hypothetical protein
VPTFGRREPEVIPVSGMRKVISQRMAEVKPGVLTLRHGRHRDGGGSEGPRAGEGAEVKVSFTTSS